MKSNLIRKKESKGTLATARSIYLARNHASKEEIKQFVQSLGYDLSTSVATFQVTNYHDETCMTSIPLAFAAFLEENNYEEVVRNAISMGKDTNTIRAIAGSIAEAMYGIDDHFIVELNHRVSEEFKDIIILFQNAI